MLRLAPAILTLVGLLLCPIHNTAVAQTRELPVRVQPLSWEFAEHKRIGSAEGAEWETFQDLKSVVFRRNGDVYVLDAGNARVHAFDSTGAHLRSFGKRGRGPGEFGQAAWLIVTAGDTIGVLDYMSTGVHLFTPAGVYVRTQLLGQQYAGISAPILAHPQGGIVFALQERRDPNVQLVWHRFGGAVTTLARTERPRQVQELETGGAQVTLTSEPIVFGPELRFAGFPDGGLAYSLSVPYKIDLRSPAKVSSVLRAEPPRRVTEADKERARTLRRAELQREVGGMMTIRDGKPVQQSGGLPAGVIDQIINSLQFATLLPAVRDLRVDGAGQLWVQRNAPAAFGPSAIDVLRSDGTYVGTIASAELPAAFGPSSRAAYIRYDEMGVAQLVIGRFR